MFQNTPLKRRIQMWEAWGPGVVGGPCADIVFFDDASWRSATAAAPLVKLGLFSLLRRTKSVIACSSISVLLQKGSANFFIRGPHKLIHNNSRAGHLTQCDRFGICYSIKSTSFSQIYYFFIFDKISSWDGWNALRAGFGPRVVVWRAFLTRSAEMSPLDFIVTAE